MTPEDRLRELLQADDDVPLRGDGLARVRERLEARPSRLARLLVPVASLAGVVAVAGAAALTVSATDDGTVSPNPAARETVRPEPSTTACTGGLCPEPRPSPSVPLSGVTTSGDGVPVWPFTTDAQAADWVTAPGARTWAADPVQVVQHLVDDLLDLPGATAVGTSSRGDVVRVVVKVGARPVSTVAVEQVGRTPEGPWSVTGAVAEDVGIRTPGDGDTVKSPLAVTGTVSGYDESVRVRLVASSGAALAETFAPAGADQPWSASLRFASTDWSVAALVASTADGNGGLRALGLIPVRRGGAAAPGTPAAGSTLLAVVDRHVVLADVLSGRTLRQLSYPPADATDSDPDRGGEDGVVWVRTRGDGCTSMVVRAGLANGAAGITADAKPLRRRLPALSEGGRSLAWVESACSDGAAETVVVRGPDARFTTTAVAPGPVSSLDVHDDGTLLVTIGARTYTLPDGASTFDLARPLAAMPGCSVVAPAWDGDVPTAWQRCADGSRQARFTANGALGPTGPAIAAAPEQTSIADGQVLLVVAGRPARLSEGRLVEVPDGERLRAAAW